MKTIVEVAQNLIKPFINSEDKKYATNIAPVETSPATAAHTAGTQLIYNGVLYNVTANIAVDDPLATTGAGANIAAADDVSEQISNVKQALSNEVSARSEVGAHNLIPFPYYNSSGTVSGNVTFTFDDDGVITATSSGTPNGWYNLASSKSLLVEKSGFKIGHQYKLFGGDTNITLYVQFKDANGTNTGDSVTNSSATGTLFTVPANTESINIFYYVATEVTNKKLYPLIVDAKDAYTGFTPYAMTNQQLTDELSVEDASANVTSVDAAFSDIDILKTGKVVQITATLAAGTTAGVKQFKVTKYAPKMISTCNGVALSDATDAGKVISAQVLDSGWAYISLSSTLTAAVKVGFVYITA